MNHYLRYNIIY